MSILKNWCKKLWIIYFSNHPYKIKLFKKLYAQNIGTSLDLPESTSMILHKEQGENIYYITAPKCVNGDINYRYIKTKKRYLSIGIFIEPDRYIYSVSNGCMLGAWGLAYDPEKRAFIDESAKEWTINLKDSPYTNLINYPAKTHISGITLSCLTNGADGGFYHFLFESIVKIHQYRSMIDRADTILFNGPATEWKLKWIMRANIDVNKIKWVSNKSHYKCEQLLFTSRLIKDQQIGNYCIKALKELFKVGAIPNITTDEKKIIWISRKGLKARDLEWEDKILTAFPKIECVNFSELSVNETINKLQSITHLIGSHGAGLSNIYLCRPGTKVLEIYPDSGTFQPCYHRVSTICNLDHSIMYLDFKNKDNPKNGLSFLTDALSKFIC